MRRTEAKRICGLPFVVAAAVTTVAGCSTILSVEEDRHLVGSAGDGVQATARDAGSDVVVDTGPPPAAGWACTLDPSPDGGSGSVELQLFVNEATSAQTSNNFAGTPVPSALLQPCAKLDLDCLHPLSSATSDDAGVARLSVPVGFDGYYLVSAAGFGPSIVTRPPQLTSESVQQGLVAFDRLSLGATFVGLAQDPSLSIVVLSVIDCDLRPAAGLKFDVGALSAGEEIVYLANSIPSRAATETDSTGSALVINVPPGFFTVSASFTADGRVVRTTGSLTRKGGVTYVQMGPDQRTIVSPDASVP